MVNEMDADVLIIGAGPSGLSLAHLLGQRGVRVIILELPVFFDEKLGCWVVTRYNDVKAIFRDNVTFSPPIALEELTTRVPHMQLVAEQEFTYLPNTSFRGRESLWVEWDPAKNPERDTPSVLDRRQQLRIGEPSSSRRRRLHDVRMSLTTSFG